MASRNDPCPCGSGKKYKACHMRADQDAARTEHLLHADAIAFSQREAAETAARTQEWQADVVPLMGPFSDSGEPGALTMVTAGGLILVSDVLSRRPAGVRERARAVLNAVSAGARQAGVFPARLYVRDDALAEALREEAAARGVAVFRAPMPVLDDAINNALAHLMESPAGGAASRPWTWAETEASSAELAEFHAAAAAFHRAQPWRRMPGGEPLLLTWPGEDEPWAASVMGGAGIQRGLALYSDADDLRDLLNDPGSNPDEHIPAMGGIASSLTFEPSRELSRGMRREVASSRWELAAPDAYPILFGVGIPGRRITAAILQRTSMACRAITAFVELDAEFTLPWRDPGTGISIDFLEEDEDDDGSEIVRLPWPLPERSSPVGPAGRGADPEAAVREPWEAVVRAEEARSRRFGTWLRRQGVSKAAEDRLLRTAEMWTDMLAGYGIPAASVTEYDLRLFLYVFAPDQPVPTKPVAKHLTRSLARIFEFYAEKERIEYPWAAAVLEELDGLAADADDVRDVLDAARPAFQAYVLARALRPVAEVQGTVGGWSMAFDEQTGRLRQVLHRRWLQWHDELVREGITDTRDLRDVLTGRQREWENRPQDALEGRTPKQVLADVERQALEYLATR